MFRVRLVAMPGSHAATGLRGGDGAAADVVPGLMGHKDLHEDVLVIQRVKLVPPDIDADATLLLDLAPLLCQQHHYPHPVLSFLAIATPWPPPPSSS